MNHYFLVAGETSGDLYGSHLMQAIRSLDSQALFTGVGGEQMRSKGLECIIEMERFQVMGLTDVLKALPRLWQQFKHIKQCINKHQPHSVILIDYPGLNLRLAAALRKSGYRGKIVQYICPSVWAHSQERIQTLVKHYDLLLTIYPFEAAYFSHSTLEVVYTGHPLIETIQRHPYQEKWPQTLGLSTSTPIVALFPGSRPSEIRKHLPLQLKTAELLKQQHPELVFALSVAQEGIRKEFNHWLKECPKSLIKDMHIISPQHRYNLMRASTLALAKSGTVTLELACHQVPTVVHYHLSMINRAYAKYFLKLKLPYYCMVNIIANHSLFPEFIERSATPLELQEALSGLFSQSQAIRTGCQRLVHALGETSAYQEAANAIVKNIKC